MDVYDNLGPKSESWMLILLSAALASIADAATGKAAFDAYRGERPSPAGALRATGRRAWPVLVSGVYRTAITLAGLVLFIVPGLYVFSIYALAPSVALFEPELSANGTLKRSRALTSGARRRAFLCYVVPYSAVIGANIGLTQLTKEIVGVGHGALAGGFAGSATAALLTPFLAALQVILYIDCRVRSEALDLEWALDEGAAPAQSIASAPMDTRRGLKAITASDTLGDSEPGDEELESSDSRSGSALDRRTRPARPWLAAALSLIKPGLGHLYSWRPVLALAVWVGYAGISALVVWAFVGSRGVIAPWSALGAFVILHFAVAWHAWYLARHGTGQSRPSRPRLVLALVAAYAAFTFITVSVQSWVKRNIAEAYTIPTLSMEPTILQGDWIIVSRRHTSVQRDHVVVFLRQGESVIARITGLPADTLQMRDGALLRNGTKVNEPATRIDGPDFETEEFAWQAAYLARSTDPRTYHPTVDNWGPLVVPARRLFVLGDNRHFSNDSRFQGFVSIDSVTGHPTHVYFSVDPVRSVLRWDRFGRRLDY